MGAPTEAPPRHDPGTAPGGCRADELCAEHTKLVCQLALFDAVADEVEEVDAASLRKDVDRAYALLTDRLLPHIHAEHDLHTRLAIHDHRRVRDEDDHGEIERLSARVAVLRSKLVGDDPRARRDIRHVMYELHALTRLHFTDELERQGVAAAGGR